MSKKEELQKKIIGLKEEYPQLEDIDWSDVIRKNPDVLENIVSGIVKVEGSRRKTNRRDGSRRMNAMHNVGDSERPFTESFSILCGDATLRSVANKLNCAPAHVYNLKLGRAQPTIEMMERIANAFNYSPSYFLEYRIYYVKESIGNFLMKNPETASTWFEKATRGIEIR